MDNNEEHLMDVKKSNSSSQSIAIVGLGCHYPGAKNPKELWENVLGHRREFRRMLTQRLPLSEYFDRDPAVPDKIYITSAAYIDNFVFDWLKRRIPKKTFEGTDIVQWLALEVAENALKDAGYTRDTVPCDRTGVILGNSLTGEQSRANTMRLRWPFVRKVMLKTAEAMELTDHMKEQFVSSAEEVYKSVFPEVNEDTLQGGLSNTVAGRIANYFDLHGGGYVVDGACSSSLLAVCTAATQLANHDLDIALAGGVDVSLDTFELIGFAKTGALAKKDMHVYDRRGEGFLPGEGCGFVVLKRLKDAEAAGDKIYAVLRGWGISSDGKGGITAPSSDGQATALIRAYQKAGYSPHELDFIEGHGTGTARGDKTELEGIAKAMNVFGRARERSCGMTSFKSIVGHTKAAAGIGAFIKTTLAANRRVLPPTANCRDRNPVFNDAASCLYPVLQGKIFDSGKIVRAGVSAMGFGGINSHITLESYGDPIDKWTPSVDERSLLVSHQDSEIFVFSANSLESLRLLLLEYAAISEEISVGELADLSASLGEKVNDEFLVRAAFIANQPAELATSLRSLANEINESDSGIESMKISSQYNFWYGNNVKKEKIGFLLPGQGSQRLGIGRTLVERFEWARDLVELADGITQKKTGTKVSSYIFRSLDQMQGEDELEEWKSLLADTKIAQPAICLISLIYIIYLEKLGVEPEIVGGHSLGELTAFYTAGAFDEEALINLAVIRGLAMDKSSDVKGCMASLATSKKIVDDLIKSIDEGYITVANVNAPEQTVVSGEEASVKKIIEVAEKRGITARLLPVSSAFHSVLMNNAVGEFRENLTIPRKPLSLKRKLYSSIDGELIGLDCEMHDHFSNQIESQVDFIKLIDNLNKEVDFILEVGSGNILSGLVNQINSESPNCFPVASKVDSNKDLLSALAQIFVAGKNINWSWLYKQRLIREFRPASEKIFIDNPCERQLADVSIERTDTDNSNYFSSSKGNDFMNLINLDERRLKNYMSQRAGFIADVIKSDMAHNGIPAENSAEVREPDTFTVNSLTPVAEKIDNLSSLEGVLTELISASTGFPVESISLQARLLDDLNLDSIKAGQLVSDFAHKLEIAGKLEATRFSNASLEEIISAANLLIDSTIDPLSQNDNNIEDRVFELITEATAFPREALSLEAHLLDDLNLDSIKSGQLISTIFREYEVDTKLVATEFSNSSIADIIQKINDVKRYNVSIPDVSTDSSEKVVINKSELEKGEQGEWVRNFIVKYDHLALPDDVKSSLDFNQKNILIISDHEHDDMVLLLCDKLMAYGAKVVIRSYENTSGNYDGFSVVGVLLSSRSNDNEISTLKSAIRRLQTIVTTAFTSHCEDITFVQFGGGYFGEKGHSSSKASCCSTGFARSLSLENPAHNIRVLDMSPDLSSDTSANNIIHELVSKKGFSAVGYNSENTRLVQKIIPQYPALNTIRLNNWSSDDVILVTGGAKGITAECGLALAKQTGARFALLGSSVISNDDGHINNSEVSINLERFRVLGVEARYYSCDLTKQTDVTQTVGRINAELGNISAVVHGAGTNKARLAQQVSIEDAIEEVSPKILGAQYLLKALADKPPKLIVGFSSIIGITGMLGNSWYAFSNENLNLLLQEYEREHTGTSVISIAYSVWQDVGMGHRMGVIDSLDKMGVGAIPAAEGVERFIQLFETDPGDKQVIVAGALGGLKTWRSLSSYRKPENFRFIDDIVESEPGVEMIVRTTLTPGIDEYLNDHDFRGSLLFPTVFGLEAMAQVACVLTDRHQSEITTIKEIKLTRPIVVNENNGEEIEIKAISTERDVENEQVVTVCIRTQVTAYNVDHFSAVFMFSDKTRELTVSPVNTELPLPINPESDLYGDYLFQGALFQRMGAVYSITPEQVILNCESRADIEVNQNGFSGDKSSEFVLGDAFYRDVLLQSVQLPATPEIVLPISIGKIELFGDPLSRSGQKIINATLKELVDKDFIWDITVMDETGLVSEKLTDYRVRTVNDPSRRSMPSVNGLLTKKIDSNTRKNDLKKLEETLLAISDECGVVLPDYSIHYFPDLGRKPKPERHIIERELVDSMLSPIKSDLAINSDEEIKIEWLSSGKPVFSGKKIKHLHLSISHDDDYCFCTVGTNEQGCDLEVIQPRSQLDWIALLGKSHAGVLDELTNHGDSLHKSCTRIWCAIESVFKVTGSADSLVSIKNRAPESILFEVVQNGRVLEVLTVALNIPMGDERILALVTSSGVETNVEAA